ncbi:MAG: DUF4399 domain-containing protein [Rhizobiaceae bacterium]|nr:DUF4399 domain-containing protein [Rhizobiaceae bacterium]
MKIITTSILATVISLSGATIALAQGAPSMEGAKQYFINLKDGDTVKGPVKVMFGLSGMGVAPAGIDKDNTGHHHILLNRAPLGEGEDGAEELTTSIPADENHLHFGKGQTEKTLDLAPGKYTLQLVLGDKDHIPHNPPVSSDVITITVQ